jgi:hypothetical protein
MPQSADEQRGAAALMKAYHLKTGILCLLQSVDSSFVIETNLIVFAKRNFS